MSDKKRKFEIRFTASEEKRSRKERKGRRISRHSLIDWAEEFVESHDEDFRKLARR